MRSPEVSSSARNSASVRSRPPAITNMFKSLPMITPSCDDDPTRSGTVGSMMSSRAPFFIAARQYQSDGLISETAVEQPQIIGRRITLGGFEKHSPIAEEHATGAVDQMLDPRVIAVDGNNFSINV